MMRNSLPIVEVTEDISVQIHRNAQYHVVPGLFTNGANVTYVCDSLNKGILSDSLQIHEAQIYGAGQTALRL